MPTANWGHNYETTLGAGYLNVFFLTKVSRRWEPHLWTAIKVFPGNVRNIKPDFLLFFCHSRQRAGLITEVKERIPHTEGRRFLLFRHRCLLCSEKSRKMAQKQHPDWNLQAEL